MEGVGGGGHWSGPLRENSLELLVSIRDDLYWTSGEKIV